MERVEDSGRWATIRGPLAIARKNHPRLLDTKYVAKQTVAIKVMLDDIFVALIGKCVDHGHGVDAARALGGKTDELVDCLESAAVLHRFLKGLFVAVLLGSLEDDDNVREPSCQVASVRNLELGGSKPTSKVLHQLD